MHVCKCAQDKAWPGLFLKVAIIITLELASHWNSWATTNSQYFSTVITQHQYICKTTLNKLLCLYMYGCQYCEKSISEFQTTYTMRMKTSLMLKQSHTKTSSRSIMLQANCLYMAKGLNYGWYPNDDVMQISTLNPKPCWREGVS